MSINHVPPFNTADFLTDRYKDNRAALVASYDNRGDSEVPYGFIYFVDGSRIGYAKLDDAFKLTDNSDPIAVQTAQEFLGKMFGNNTESSSVQFG